VLRVTLCREVIKTYKTKLKKKEKMLLFIWEWQKGIARHVMQRNDLNIQKKTFKKRKKFIVCMGMV